ncbi:MAG: Flp pilus assembly complex ATPase component TadA, partial [Elusimicrobia bacterium]|nr:Flp pilus assembly complex ATPase component TadA [Elusimicrobiota bacterium]
LRHDPDVMMVGEVRDLETAEIAVRVALTGHLVFSTLHTNDAASAATRLQDIGVEPYLIASSVLCVIAQRLVRVICAECREAVPPPPEMARDLADGPDVPKAFRGRGCPACKGTGYRGRTVIYEMLPMTDALRGMIADRRPAHALREEALRGGMRPLRRSGWRKVLDGTTTADDVMRATLQEGL